MLVYPQLPFAEATARLLDLSTREASELPQLVTTDTSNATFYSLGANRATAETLLSVREQVLEVAYANGFPASTKGHSDFDSSLTSKIEVILTIVPADAMEESVWSFLTLNVLPDVAAWRYPFRTSVDGSVNSSYERLIGKPRNVFRKLWHRSYIFGPSLGARLGEDNWESFYGRSSLGGNKRVARMIAEEFFRRAAETEALGKTVRYQDSLRDAMKRMLRLTGVVSIHAMPDNLVQDLINRAFDETSMTQQVEPAMSALTYE